MDRDRNHRLFTQRDLGYLVKLPLFFVSSWILPERAWKRVAVSAARIVVGLKSRTFSNRAKQFALTFGIDAADPHAKQAALRASFVSSEAIMQCFREYRWGGWHPHILVIGREHLEGALDKGNGAILWIQDMPYSKLVAKKALAGIGFPPHHLTRPSHGLSGSRFGIRFLNRLWTRIEDRYLSERITIRGESAVGALRTLRARLKDNLVVSITVGDEAVKTVEAPFFNAKIKIANGPIALSLRHGAPLIPVFTIRSGERGFEVIIGTPLSTGSGTSAGESISTIANEYASRLEHLYREHIDQRVLPGCVLVTQG